MRRPGRRVLIVLTAVAVAAAAYLAWNYSSRTVAAARLPSMPEASDLPAAMVEQLVKADADARRSPTDAASVGALAMAYHADLVYDQAASAYTLAAELEPTNWHWTYYKALVHLERGDAVRAAEALQAVVTAQPHFALAWWRLGETAFKQARYEDADAAYARAEGSASVNSDHAQVMPYARTGRARAALHRGNAAAAERILAQVITADPQFGAAQRLMADALRAQGRDADAERHTTRAAALRAYTAPSDWLLDALVDISRSSVFLLRHAAALDLVRDSARRERLVRRALDADPDNPDVVYEMGAVLQQLRRPADALPFFARHLQMSGDEQQTLVQIGKCYSDLGRLDDAEATLRRALAAGDDAVGFYNLGFVLEQRKQDAEAEASYRRAIALNPGLARARNNLGSLLARRGRMDEATTQLLESIRLDPASPDAYTNLSAVMLQTGAPARAADLARLAIEADPRHADAHVNLAVALVHSGNIALARRHLDEALRLDPRHAAARANKEALAQ